MLLEATTGQSLTYRPNRSEQHIESLVKAHSPLVRRIAWHVHSRMSSLIEVPDLIQIGMITLVEAARSFEDRGLAFGPYAATRVRGAMIDQLRKDARMCRSGMAGRRRLIAVRADLESTLHRRATDCEMAEAMEITPAEYHATTQAALPAQMDSLDEVYNDHDPWFANDQPAADEQMAADQLKSALAERINQLSEREALILQLYFVEELNLDEIGLILGVGAARVCQIKRAALNQLRTLMAEWQPEATQRDALDTGGSGSR
jgi:RNA polymerase sigma factor FliA